VIEEEVKRRRRVSGESFWRSAWKKIWTVEKFFVAGWKTFWSGGAELRDQLEEVKMRSSYILEV
jgi:hypothetical protein